ncbi:acyl-CoA dehydrogenase family protein [Nodosilinea sp. LEGE 06152]|uniref:acyl-CoA dehydrogenase family protein n=1 Tax=Nodosilinea sp. LEGE 06152 TaxID=2777966 RepID=UPI001880AD20|nr:acyl-CoA dehydrogenase family protein [Nodosilinea sp. LEGE 06152]MBE9156976.1 acyl-CoA dehydrogenase family protein [Nodosilinea sp. LEGE 06152]
MQATRPSITFTDYLSVATQVAEQLAADAVNQDREAGLPTAEVEALKQSGLLLLSIPRQYGGAGATWPQVYQAVQALANAQGSVGQLYANHVSLVAAAEAIGRPGQAEYYYRLTAQHNLFWANALNGRDSRLKIAPAPEGGFRVNGVKSFGTGVAAADISLIGAMPEGGDQPLVFVLPKDRPGWTYNHDWDNIGQRRTASGSYQFDNVVVNDDELIGPPPVPESAFPTLIFLVAQMGKVFTYLGVAEGALKAARNYTVSESRPWMFSGVESASQDPYILQQYGEAWAQLQAAIALADQAAEQIQMGWQKKTALTFAERGEIAVTVAAAKAVAITAGLAITNQIFDGMGARATASRHGFDRYWRDLRTFTLHDPVAYKFRNVGNYVLNGEYPAPSQYS